MANRGGGGGSSSSSSEVTTGQRYGAALSSAGGSLSAASQGKETMDDIAGVSLGQVADGKSPSEYFKKPKGLATRRKHRGGS